MPEVKEKGSVAPLLLGGLAVAGVGTGLYLWLHKPGVKPGTRMLATFKYRHVGNEGDYYFQVALGHIRLIYFDDVEGLKWRVLETVKGHDSLTDCITKVGFKLPEMMDAGEYDAEASIRDENDNLIIRHQQKAAVIVPK